MEERDEAMECVGVMAGVFKACVGVERRCLGGLGSMPVLVDVYWFLASEIVEGDLAGEGGLVGEDQFGDREGFWSLRLGVWCMARWAGDDPL